MNFTTNNILELQRVEQLLQLQLKEFNLKISCLVNSKNLVILLDSQQIMTANTEEIISAIREYLVENNLMAKYQVLVYFKNSQVSNHKTDVTSDSQISETKKSTKSDTNKPISWKILILALAGGLGVMGLLILIYVLRMPCVIGECEPITQAQNQSQSILFIFRKNAVSLKEVKQASSELLESVEQLETVPIWSGRYGEANNLSQEYRKQLEKLNEIASNLSIGYRASDMAKNPPYQLPRWEEIKGLWEKSITYWEELSLDPLYRDFAVLKIQEYNNNLNIIKGRIKQEKQATAYMQAAQEAAKLAEVRSVAAQSLTNWQVAEVSWQIAIKKLEAISSSTTPYPEAQNLLNTYKDKLRQIQEKKQKEDFASRLYNQAYKQAQLARTAQSRRQWSVAVEHWRSAVGYMTQVPKESFQYKQTEALANSYQEALLEAQQKVQNVLDINQVRTELNKVCGENKDVCNYVLSQESIKVYLSPNYLKQIWQIALHAKVQPESNTQGKLVQELNQLEKQLRNVSSKTGIPVEVLNSEGVLVVKYNP